MKLEILKMAFAKLFLLSNFILFPLKDFISTGRA